jgi:uncharacterized damage-inducible protein DinB
MTPVDLLLTLLDQAYDRRSWHGTNLRGSLRGLTPAGVTWRPRPDRHNIQEIAVHAAYWKYAVHRRLTGARRGSFAQEGSNWFSRQATDPKQWKADLALLAEWHGRLRGTVAALSPRQLQAKARGSAVSNFDLIAGVAAHDFYHAGQVQLLKRLLPHTSR